MNTFHDTARSACYTHDDIVITMESGVDIRFPVADNPRLSKGTAEQLGNIEISPFGLHWPSLDEDLSFRGLMKGDHGQPRGPSAPARREMPSW